MRRGLCFSLLGLALIGALGTLAGCGRGFLFMEEREPWRHDLAAAFRPMAPFRAPRRYRLFHRLQQYALAIAYIVALGVTWLLASLASAPS